MGYKWKLLCANVHCVSHKTAITTCHKSSHGKTMDFCCNKMQLCTSKYGVLLSEN